MEQYPDAELAARNLLYNRQELGAKLGIEASVHTPPASHYPHIYLWDSCFAAIINARAGEKWHPAAQNELLAVLAGQRADGFIPNMQFAERGRELDPERWVAFGKSADGSNYTQPPVLALAVTETYEASREHDPLGAAAFLHAAYPKLQKYYTYLERERSNSSEDALIGVIHPHETGRDSDPTFDFMKPRRLKRDGIETPGFIDKANTVIDYLSIIAHGVRLRRAGGDSAQVREIMWINDVMMNCMYADNLYQMSGLAAAAKDEEGHRHFLNLARTVEQQIIEDMWLPDARGGKGAFYALNENGDPITETSISSLFPLALPNIKENQLGSVLDLMDTAFDTPYPLPTVAIDSPNYDPHNRESDRLWRGSTWINTNWYIVERGIKAQLQRPDLAQHPDLRPRLLDWEAKIINSSRELLARNGSREHYNPITGEGQRRRVKNFAWSNLGYVILSRGE